jgi:transcriptional regulator with XRE-family HTH domain
MMGEKLREVRVLRRITQYDLTKATQIPQCKISLIERGYVEPKDDEKKKLAKALGIKPEEIWNS